jgi:hypothetical protein
LKVLGWIIGLLWAFAVVFGVDALLAEILHLIFPSVLSFWKWFGLVFLVIFIVSLINQQSKS